jgi:hypothetical protein
MESFGQKVYGEKLQRSYPYVDKLGYDKFEQRTYLKYGNGAETFYSYEPLRRRLEQLSVHSGEKIMDNKYSYDAVSNVTGIKTMNGKQGAYNGTIIKLNNMFKFSYILVLSYSLLVIFLLLISKVSFWHGLGDLYYMMELILFLCSIILLSFFKHKINYSILKYLILIFSIVVIVYFSLKLTIHRGVENPWNDNIFINE